MFWSSLTFKGNHCPSNYGWSIDIIAIHCISILSTQTLVFFVSNKWGGVNGSADCCPHLSVGSKKDCRTPSRRGLEAWWDAGRWMTLPVESTWCVSRNMQKESEILTGMNSTQSTIGIHLYIVLLSTEMFNTLLSTFMRNTAPPKPPMGHTSMGGCTCRRGGPLKAGRKMALWSCDMLWHIIWVLNRKRNMSFQKSWNIWAMNNGHSMATSFHCSAGLSTDQATAGHCRGPNETIPTVASGQCFQVLDCCT